MNWGKRSGKSEEAGECNTWGGGKPANMAKSDWEPVTGVNTRKL